MKQLCFLAALCLLGLSIPYSVSAQQHAQENLREQIREQIRAATIALKEKYEMEILSRSSEFDVNPYDDSLLEEELLVEEVLPVDEILPAFSETECEPFEDLPFSWLSSPIVKYQPETECPVNYVAIEEEVSAPEAFALFEDSVSLDNGASTQYTTMKGSTFRSGINWSGVDTWQELRDACYKAVQVNPYRLNNYDCKDFSKWFVVCVAHHAKRLKNYSWSAFAVNTPRCRGRCSGLAGRYGHRWVVTYDGKNFCAGEPQRGQYNSCCYSKSDPKAAQKAMDCGYRAWCARNGKNCRPGGGPTMGDPKVCGNEKCSRSFRNNVCEAIGIDPNETTY